MPAPSLSFSGFWHENYLAIIAHGTLVISSAKSKKEFSRLFKKR